MAIGPVQLLVFGFDHPDFRGEVLAEFDRLKENDTVRIVDAILVYKGLDGNVSAVEASQLGIEDRAEFGAKVGALVGLGALGEEGLEAGAELGAEAAVEGDILPTEEIVDVLAEIPEDSAAALILIEHRWAIPLRDALLRAGGYPVLSQFISALDLVEIGLATHADVDAEKKIAEKTEKAKSKKSKAKSSSEPVAVTA